MSERSGGISIIDTDERPGPASPKGSTDAAEAWKLMRDLAHHPDTLRRAHALGEEVGLTPSIAKALAHLTPGKATPMRELGGALRCDNSYVTTVVDTLERQGLVLRLPHPTDRRIKVVELTDAGAAIAIRLHAVLDQPPSGFAVLSDEEASELLRLIRIVSPTELPRY